MPAKKGNRVPARCHKDRPHYGQGLCSACWQRKRYNEDPEPARKRLRERMHRSDLKKHYGISIEEYDALNVAQRGVCAICGGLPVGKTRLSVDHDHQTAKVRGLLCDLCNRGLGYFRDDPLRLMAAIEYLKRNQ